ncbi:hypothetical protein [Roseovarius sp.]|uniref:hypothetical protein n=1 Tax=Roseovarius sp. TaxID=1486281 RepID=UPI002611ACBB|nr:hypothetical protein [Roseovarius sp.]
MFILMKRIIHISTLAFGLALAASGAQAACIVEYKAKRDNPLELFYDVMQVGGDCSDASARVQKKLSGQGLTLLKVLSARKK